MTFVHLLIGVVFLSLATVLAWLGSRDRRWLFLGIAIYVIVPLLASFGLPLIKVTPEVRDAYDAVAKLPKDAVVLLACDYDPGSKPELHPMTFAIVEQLARQHQKFAVVELWPAGVEMAKDVIEKVAIGKYHLKPRTDFVHLGFKTGAEVVIQSLGNSLKNTYPTDVDGVPVQEIPVLKGISSVKDFALIINISAGTPGTMEWVQQAGSRYDIPIIGGTTGVQAPQVYPYYPKQLVGLLGGMAAAAEYERLVDVKGTATQGMEAQSMSHALIVIFVILGNIVYFYGRRRAGRA